MNLLYKSTKGNRNDVKILVYGQSISEQEWWLEVKRAVKERFPEANIIMENKAIGGFSTQYLFKTVEMDVSSFYPDLVILHDYGNEKDYEKVLSTIRGRTASEIAIMTDHYIGENKWSDTMSYYILPALAEKYKCDIINIRDPWKAYLKDNGLEPKALLKDGIHLNDYGNFLMAELVKPIFYFKSRFAPDPFGLQTVFMSGTDLKCTEDTITVNLTGNRADLFFDTTRIRAGDTLEILLDGVKPSTFPGTYFMTRPYGTNDKVWPWDLPSMICVDHTTPWLSEEWSIIYTQVKPPYINFSFKISGTLTGNDGKGKASKDFISRSGRVIIKKGDAEKGGDWHLNRSYKVLKTLVHRGDTVKWKTYTVSTDLFVTEKQEEPSIAKSVILFQGVPNTLHTLKIICRNACRPPIEMLKVYRPYSER
jgi:hypothetical protein